MAVFRDDYLYCYGPNTAFDNIKIKKINKGKFQFSCIFPSLPLLDGKYKLSVAVWDKEETDPYDYYACFFKFEIKNKNKILGLVKIPSFWQIEGVKICENYFNENIFNEINRLENINDLKNKNIELKSFKLADKSKKTRYLFSTAEYLKLSFDLNYNNAITNPNLHLFIFRKDGILCFQSGIKNIGRGRSSFS